MSGVWRSGGSRPPAPDKLKLKPAPVKESDPTRGFCCGDLITVSGATVCRNLQLREKMSIGRPEADPDLSGSATIAIWLGIAQYDQTLWEWTLDEDKGCYKQTYKGERRHLYHVVLLPGGVMGYVYETPDRRPCMKLIDAIAV